MLVLLHYLGKHRNTKIACFHSNIAVLYAFPEFNQSLLDFFSFVDLHLILTLLYTPKSCNQLRSALACWGHISGEMKFAQQLLYSVVHTVHGACMRCVAERQIILSPTTCLITANTVEMVRYPTNRPTVH